MRHAVHPFDDHPIGQFERRHLFQDTAGEELVEETRIDPVQVGAVEAAYRMPVSLPQQKMQQGGRCRVHCGADAP